MIPVAYIPIEKKNRELASKLLVAHELVRRGGIAVVGFSRAVFANAPNFPAGVIYFKGMNRVQFEYMRHLPALGHAVVATDEEALGASGLLLVKDCWPETQPLLDLVFCQGAEHEKALVNCRGFEARQLKRTGNPRLDLLRPAFSRFWAAEVEKLKTEHGRFVLVNTDMSSINAKHHDLAQYKSSLVQIGWLDPEEPADLALMDDHINHDRENLRAVSDFVREMDRLHPERRVVIRPHPGENPTHWRNLAARCSNVRVVVGSEPVPWLLAATCLVQAGCTTGVEATVLGTPSISLIRNPTKNPFPNYRLTNRVNPVANTVGAAINMVQRLLDGTIDAVDPRRSLQALSSYIDIDDSSPAYRKIVDGIEAVGKSKPSSSLDDISAIGDNVDAALRRAVSREAFAAGFFSPEELHAKLDILAQQLQLGSGPTVKDLGWGVYALGPPEPSPRDTGMLSTSPKLD